ncbi:hypothetical protein [Cytobacillus sp. IB215665]|nr:hypothetical protein [Cytobacillus sp. IB215665]MDX8364146.1 hypothetical protein [Cytobacillus sp. IB215665]
MNIEILDHSFTKGSERMFAIVMGITITVVIGIVIGTEVSEEI